MKHKTISIDIELHEILRKIRAEYINRAHRNITLGYIMYLYLTDDPVIIDIKKQILDR